MVNLNIELEPLQSAVGARLPVLAGTPAAPVRIRLRFSWYCFTDPNTVIWDFFGHLSVSAIHAADV